MEGTVKVIEVIGMWEAFDPEEVDMWGGHLKFVFRDNEIVETSQENQAAWHQLIQQAPELAEYAASKTLLSVYLQDNESKSWKDVTGEFARKASKYGY
jgi:hypothetical protein